ncbi:hypothetical protein OG571_45880 (plasmid) [Streptomyces sp. NBC_01369]|uniref:hypothetical protein n=1 Tax=Streptomyces sp. NBC_01369 TaxID=2903842 RepID=UPI0032493D31
MLLLALLSSPVWIGYLVMHPESRPSRWIRRFAGWAWGWTLGLVVCWYRSWVSVQALRRLLHALRHLPAPVRGDFGGPEMTEVKKAVRQWCNAAPWAALGFVVKAWVLAWAVVNAGIFVHFARELWERAQNPELGGGPSRWAQDQMDEAYPGQIALDPLGALLRWVSGAGEWLADTGKEVWTIAVHPGDRPTATATVAVALLLVVRLAAMVFSAVPVFIRLSDAQKTRSTQGPQSQPTFTQPVKEVQRWRPLVVVLAATGTVGQAYRQWARHETLQAPRVSLKSVERVVWSAWRTRHGRVRHERRRELRAHAARVVGAVRAAEARQDTDADTGAAFEAMARMLLTIAERYAEGRTGCLLDAEDMAGAEEAMNREWVRLVVLGVLVVGAVAGGAALDLPGEAIASLAGFAALVASGALYGTRMPITDVIDVMRGQSRK